MNERDYCPILVCMKSNISKLKKFIFQNDFANISGTVYRYEMFLYAKRTGGPPHSAHIMQRTVALLQYEI